MGESLFEFSKGEKKDKESLQEQRNLNICYYKIYNYYLKGTKIKLRLRTHPEYFLEGIVTEITLTDGRVLTKENIKEERERIKIIRKNGTRFYMELEIKKEEEMEKEKANLVDNKIDYNKQLKYCSDELDIEEGDFFTLQDGNTETILNTYEVDTSSIHPSEINPIAYFIRGNISEESRSIIKERCKGLCELHKRLFNLGGDLSNTDLKETGTFKQTIGRDQLQVKRKYLKDLIFKNYAKHVFAANELPKVWDMTDGFWTKWILVEFPYKFVTQKEIDKLKIEDKINHKVLDPEIIEKISTPVAMSGFLNKCLDGLDRLLKQKDFSNSKGTKEIKDLWVRKADSFRSFCLDKLEESFEESIGKEELRKEYHKYCKEHKTKGAGDKEIKATLQDLFGVSERRITIGDFREFAWYGVKFRCWGNQNE